MRKNHGIRDTEAGQELKLFTENDGDIYRQQTTSILKNLATKKAQGKYDHDKAAALFMYLTETGAKKYAREFGGPGAEARWHEMFPIDVRRLVAAEWRDEFEVEFANGSYDNMLPKKYQNLLAGVMDWHHNPSTSSPPATSRAPRKSASPPWTSTGDSVWPCTPPPTPS